MTQWKKASGWDAGSRFRDVDYYNYNGVKVYVALNTHTVGRKIAVSLDGMNWASQDLPGSPASMYSVLGYNDMFHVVGTLSSGDNTILRSV